MSDPRSGASPCDREGCDNPATGYDAWGQWCEEHNGLAPQGAACYGCGAELPADERGAHCSACASGAKCDRCKSPWHHTNQCPIPKATERAIPLNKRTAI